MGGARGRPVWQGDALFGAGSRALAGAHAAHPESATYAYEFAWRSQALNGQLVATHAMELPFVLDLAQLPQLRDAAALLGPDEPHAELASLGPLRHDRQPRLGPVRRRAPDHDAHRH